MKNLIFKKFLLDVSIFFVISIFIMGLIVWTIQAINYFDFVSQDGHGLKVYFLFTLLNFPKVIHRIIPFIFFISLFYTIIRYEINNELNIFWVNGISKIKFINIILIFSIFVMIVQIFLGSYLSPLSQLNARNLIKNSNSDFLANLINQGRFINAVKGLTIFIEKKSKNNFSNIFIDDSTKGHSRMIYAESGKLLNDQKNKIFVLYNGKVINIDEGRINEFKFDQIDFALETFGTNSITKPKIQEMNSKYLLSCFFDKIFILENKCVKDRFVKEVKEELLKRYYKPIYIPLIALICCFLFYSGKFLNNYQSIKKYVFLIVFIIITVSESSLRYSTSSVISLAIYFLIPIILFINFYLLFYFRINNA